MANRVDASPRIVILERISLHKEDHKAYKSLNRINQRIGIRRVIKLGNFTTIELFMPFCN